MSENKQEEPRRDNTENNKTQAGENIRKRHTWIGDADEIRPDQLQRTVARMTQIIPETDSRSTKLVEKQRKAYKGFITDEEVKATEEQAEADRKARAADRAARLEASETRIYTGFGSGMEESEPEKEESPIRPAKEKKIYRFDVTDSRKFKRLMALVAIFIIAVAFDLGFLLMKHSTAVLPGKTAEVQEQTEELKSENKKLEKKADKLGDYDQLKELRDSWQRIKDQLDE